ncbi:MAG: CPBP family intramembrane glutamic endopeptidase [Spirochaetota bacterium]
MKQHTIYFAITFLWSWSLWFIPILLGLQIDHPVTMFLYICGGIAPSSTGIILARLRGDSYWKSFLRRSIDVRLITKKYLFFIFIIIPATTFAGLLMYVALTGIWPKLYSLEKYIANPQYLLPFAIFMLFFGPIPEELGWRGFALDHLEQSYSRIAASIILGFFWMMWHLPLFFIQGTYQYNLLKASPLLMVDFMIQFYPLSIMMDWVYHNTKKSIASGVLFHFCINFFGEIIDIPNETKYFRTMVQLIIAIMILYALKKRAKK